MPTALPVVDANIFIRHIRQDHPDYSPRASVYLGRIEAGELVATTDTIVLAETVHVLQSFYRTNKSAIAQVLLPIVALPSLKLPHKARLRNVFDWYVRYNLSFVDAYLAVMTREQKLPAVVSFDRNYDRIPGVARVEP